MNLSVKDMALCALFAALISIGAVLSIPLPGGVPFSIQPIFAMLAGVILGSKRGAISMTVYTLMGLAGLPVFSNLMGGFAIVKTPKFGYILGFILCAYVTGKIVEFFKHRKSKIGYFIGPLVGVFLTYLLGVPYLYMIFYRSTGGVFTWPLALTYGFYPFIVLDLLKVALVILLSLTLVPRLEKMDLY